MFQLWDLDEVGILGRGDHEEELEVVEEIDGTGCLMLEKQFTRRGKDGTHLREK
jgi:hypothetical protein